MKAAPFAYARPTTVDEAVGMLGATDGDGKVLAGGQSLVPILAMRLARPSTLIDLNGVDGLDSLVIDGDHLSVGAMVRQRRAERSPLTGRVPLLGMALPWVGHRELRSRGTIGGSLAHADPAAELPAVACCVGATFEITGPGGARLVAARDFFSGAMTTAIGPAEILTTVRFPVARPGDGFGFAEVARRHGDFALAGVAVRVWGDGSALRAASLTAFGVSDRPVTAEVTDPLRRAVASGGSSAASGGSSAASGASAASQESSASQELSQGGGREEAALAAALVEPMADLACDLVDTSGDPHGSPAYRQRLLTHLAATQLARAYLHSGASAPAPSGAPR